MIKQSHTSIVLTHLALLAITLLVFFPVYIAIVASTHSLADLLQAPMPLLPGKHFFANYKAVLVDGVAATAGQNVVPMLLNSLLMALAVAFTKVFTAILAGYALVYFEFPYKKLCFFLIFITLMLPIEVRIVPTFTIVAQLHLLNSFAGLTLPLVASATATFLFRQYFKTLPQHLLDAARIDGAGPVRFFIDILLPLSRANIAALFVIMFVYGWNQYLWPLLVTTDDKMTTVVMGIKRLASVADQVPEWHYIMAITVLAMLPPLLVVVVMQRLFVKGLLDAEK